MSGGEHDGQRHAAASRRAAVVELRDQGTGFREIAQQLGVSVSTAWGDYQRALRDLPAQALAKHAATLDQRRAEQLARIDMEREAAMAVLETRHLTVSNGRVVAEVTGTDDEGRPLYGPPLLDDGPVLAAIATLVKLDDQEAKLLGMYTPTRISLEAEQLGERIRSLFERITGQEGDGDDDAEQL